ncbi:MAG TPA: glycogen-binding domain-containing protein [bacterium]|nr:glycogen-binding domain-containing protein [bacterium]
MAKKTAKKTVAKKSTAAKTTAKTATKTTAKKSAACGSKAKKAATKKRITFALVAPNASSVAVVGSFNNWDTEKHPLKKDAKGVWKKAVMLEPGAYEYKFLVDGDWRLDPNCETVVPNPHGTGNNIVKV